MKHLIICPEYPPASHAGGIGTYVHQISRLLAEKGETVHVIAARWIWAPLKEERVLDGLIIHRVGELRSRWIGTALMRNRAKELQGLRASSFPPQCFSYEAGLLAEKLIEQANIDVIESQEYEAPLYYLMLRRALGLGPKRQPPCIVHMHSPMEFIVRGNEWNIGHPHFGTAKSLEDYCIREADALLCPSHYLARQAESHYGLPDGAIKVIPLPVTAVSSIYRDPGTWERGAILYVGRLERRKGVLEWIQAAVLAACKSSELRFEFVGANCLSTDRLGGKQIIARLVPEQIQNQFVFHDQQPQAELTRFFRNARVAVVPSRWENFPNTCLEAMGTGLPVISTREGGMVEMIDDGRTGWLAASADVDGLYESLQRAIRASPADLARMGTAASASVCKMCNSARILEEHLEFRRHMMNQSAVHSIRLPHKPPTSQKVSYSGIDPGSPRPGDASRGIAAVITVCNSGAHLDKCLESIRRQTRPTVAAVIVDDNSTDAGTQRLLRFREKDGWTVLSKPCLERAPARNLGIRHVLDSGVHPAGFCFLRAEDTLAPRFVEICDRILHDFAEVGLISGWIEFIGKKKPVVIHPCPGFPRQWIVNEIAPFAAIRTEALMEVGQFRPGMDDDFESWDLFNAVLAANWAAVAFPGILGACRFKRSPDAGSYLNIQRGMREAMLKRFPELVAADAVDIILTAEVQTGLMLRQHCFMARQRLSRAIDRLLRVRPLSRLKSAIRNG